MTSMDYRAGEEAAIRNVLESLTVEGGMPGIILKAQDWER